MDGKQLKDFTINHDKIEMKYGLKRYFDNGGDGMNFTIPNGAVYLNENYTLCIREPYPTGTKILIYGDSISLYSEMYDSYYQIFADRRDLEAKSMSMYGRSVQEGVSTEFLTNSLENLMFNPTPEQLENSPVTPLDRDVKFLMIRLGIADALAVRNSPVTATPVTFKAAYKRCLERFLELGWTRNRIKLINIGSYLGFDPMVVTAIVDYNIAIAELGAEYGFQVVDIQAYDATQQVNFMYSDWFNPNSGGHVKHGIYLTQVL